MFEPILILFLGIYLWVQAKKKLYSLLGHVFHRHHAILLYTSTYIRGIIHTHWKNVTQQIEKQISRWGNAKFTVSFRSAKDQPVSHSGLQNFSYFLPISIYLRIYLF